MGNTAVGIAYLDGPRLRASLLAAADWIDAGKEELDRINAFPVTDGDTGTNFCSTFRAVAEAVRKLGPSPLPTVTKTMTQQLDGRLTPRPKLLRFGIAHAGAEDIAERLRTALVAKYTPRSCFVDDVTSAVGVHVGPGAWSIFYQIED